MTRPFKIFQRSRSLMVKESQQRKMLLMLLRSKMLLMLLLRLLHAMCLSTLPLFRVRLLLYKMLLMLSPQNLPVLLAYHLYKMHGFPLLLMVNRFRRPSSTKDALSVPQLALFRHTLPRTRTSMFLTTKKVKEGRRKIRAERRRRRLTTKQSPLGWLAESSSGAATTSMLRSPAAAKTVPRGAAAKRSEGRTPSSKPRPSGVREIITPSPKTRPGEVREESTQNWPWRYTLLL